ncbi:MAG: sulfatase-like hydrolase/transferase, partial [Planctomycetota bacterium]
MKKQPHILLILSDEHRGQAMGHTGDPNVRTPVMDQLAAEGVSFERAYANCPVCTPSRGTIFSGRHAHAGPVQTFWDVYKPAAPSLATLLGDAGYHSCYFGKWHCGTVRDQTHPDVVADPNFDNDCYRTPESMRAGFKEWRGYENRMQYWDCHYYRNDDLTPTPLEGYETDVFTDETIQYLKDYDR